jgi:hypothetical protein
MDLRRRTEATTMADVPETKPCDHSDCGGIMRLKTGADPTMQGTSQGRQSGTVLYYQCDRDVDHVHVVSDVK